MSADPSNTAILVHDESACVPQHVLSCVADVLASLLPPPRTAWHIHGAFLFGSRLYGIARHDADWDFNISVDGDTGHPELTGSLQGEDANGLVNVNVYQHAYWQHHLVDQGVMWALSSRWVPSWCNVTEPLCALWGAQVRLQPLPLSPTPPPSLIARAAIADASHHWVKARRLWSGNEYVARKNVVHGIRTLLLALQVLRDERVHDWEAGNVWWHRLVDPGSDALRTWSDVKADVRPELEASMCYLDHVTGGDQACSLRLLLEQGVLSAGDVVTLSGGSPATCGRFAGVSATITSQGLLQWVVPSHVRLGSVCGARLCFGKIASWVTKVERVMQCGSVGKQQPFDPLRLAVVRKRQLRHWLGSVHASNTAAPSHVLHLLTWASATKVVPPHVGHGLADPPTWLAPSTWFVRSVDTVDHVPDVGNQTKDVVRRLLPHGAVVEQTEAGARLVMWSGPACINARGALSPALASGLRQGDVEVRPVLGGWRFTIWRSHDGPSQEDAWRVSCGRHADCTKVGTRCVHAVEGMWRAWRAAAWALPHQTTWNSVREPPPSLVVRWLPHVAGLDQRPRLWGERVVRKCVRANGALQWVGYYDAVSSRWCPGEAPHPWASAVATAEHIGVVGSRCVHTGAITSVDDLRTCTTGLDPFLWHGVDVIGQGSDGSRYCLRCLTPVAEAWSKLCWHRRAMARHAAPSGTEFAERGIDSAIEDTLALELTKLDLDGPTMDCIDMPSDTAATATAVLEGGDVGESVIQAWRAFTRGWKAVVHEVTSVLELGTELSDADFATQVAHGVRKPLKPILFTARRRVRKQGGNARQAVVATLRSLKATKLVALLQGAGFKV